MTPPRKSELSRMYESLAEVPVNLRQIVARAAVERVIDESESFSDEKYQKVANSVNEEMNFADVVTVLTVLVRDANMPDKKFREIVRSERTAVSVRAESEEHQEEEREKRRQRTKVLCPQCEQPLVQCVTSGCRPKTRPQTSTTPSASKNEVGVQGTALDPVVVSSREPTWSPSPQLTQVGVKNREPTLREPQREPQETTEIKENDNDKEQSDDESMECSELTAFNNPAALLDIASWKKHIQAGASLASLKSALDEYFMVPLQIARVSDHARYQQRVLLRFMVEACVMPFEEAALPIMDLILRGRMYAEGKSPDQLKKFDEIVSASCTPPRYAGALKAVNETDTRGWRPRTQGFGRGRGQQQGRQQQGRLPLEVWSKLSPEDRERVKSSRK